MPGSVFVILSLARTRQIEPMGIRKLLVLFLLCLSGAVGAAGKWANEFPPYPGASTLGAQHVNSMSGHVLWSAYATTDEPLKVRAFYAGHYRNGSGNDQGYTFRVGKKRLSIYPADSTAYPALEHKPRPGERTVIIVSQFTCAE